MKRLEKSLFCGVLTCPRGVLSSGTKTKSRGVEESSGPEVEEEQDERGGDNAKMALSRQSI